MSDEGFQRTFAVPKIGGGSDGQSLRPVESNVSSQPPATVTAGQCRWGHIWTFAGLRPEGVPFGTPCDCGLTTWGAK